MKLLLILLLLSTLIENNISAKEYHVYYNGAVPYEKEQNYIANSGFDPNIELIVEGDEVYLQFFTDSLPIQKTQPVTAERLGKVIVTKQAFENPDGSALQMDVDYFKQGRNKIHPTAGPFENISEGESKIKVW
jgi:alpha-N-arabinofuranosidase